MCQTDYPRCLLSVLHRCSPLSFAGPKRYTEPPCKLDQLPRIDAVIISHNQLSINIHLLHAHHHVS